MYDLIIVGAGIAGHTAAIYAARKRMNFLYVSETFGGQYYESGEILNYPGIVETNGVEFAKIMKKQMDFNKIKLSENEKVEKITKKGNVFNVKTNKGNYESKTVIVATGSVPRKLQVPGEEKLSKRGVTYCAICDGPLYNKMDIAVVGGGNSALEAVDFTNKIAKNVYLIHRRKEFRAYEYLMERLKKMKNVKIITDAQVKEIIGDKAVTGLKYGQNGKEKELKISGVFIEVGRIPSTDFLKGLVKLDKEGHIIVDVYTKTSVPGLFSAGDCTSIQNYQYSVSAGQGCTALLEAAKYIAELEGKK